MGIDRTVSARGAEAITAGDSGSGAANGEVLKCRALYVGGAGTAVVVMEDGSEVTLVGLPAGSFLPIEVSRIKAAGTDASDFVVFF